MWFLVCKNAVIDMLLKGIIYFWHIKIYVCVCVSTCACMRILCTFSVNRYKYVQLSLQVQMWASNKINKEERSFIGKWDLQSLISSSSEFIGPEKSDARKEVPRHVKFTFRNPVRCRLIWITLTLPRATSSSVNLEKDFSLLSLGDGDLSLLNRQASLGSAFQESHAIHAKKILVVGKPVRKEVTPSTSFRGSDKLNIKAWLEKPPPLGRFKVSCYVLIIIHVE